MGKGKEAYYRERAIIATTRGDYEKAIQILIKAIVERFLSDANQ